MVLVSTSVTALLVRSTFCRRDQSPVRVSSGLQPIPQEPRGDFGNFLWFPTHLFHLLEVIVQLGPFGPPDLLADQLWRKDKGGGSGTD